MNFRFTVFRWAVTVSTMLLFGCGSESDETARPSQPLPLIDPDSAAPKLGEEGGDEAACRRNLQRIGDAIQSYRIQSEGVFPEDLGDLLGEYLPGTAVFLCPAAKRKGEFGVKDANIRDPKGKLISSYTWELSSTSSFKLEKNEEISFRDFKLLQMQTAVGDKVPVLRCDHHDGKWLNMTALGDIYESEVFWESLWVDRVPLPYLTPEAVRISTQLPRERLQPRPESATARMLDLRPWCNARLEDPWILWREGEELTEFAESLDADGLFAHDGVRFDAAGLIQLNGVLGKNYSIPHYPKSVDGIAISQKFSRLHVLCGLAFSSPDGSTVAEIRLRHLAANGDTPQTTTVPWRHGIDVANLGFPMDGEPGVTSAGSSVAWTGFCDLSRRFKLKVRLFHLVVENPLPDTEIESFDFVGGFEESAPFILGVTLQP